MSKKWPDADMARILDAYRNYDVLWNPQIELYRNRQARGAALEAILQYINKPKMSENDLKNKINCTPTSTISRDAIWRLTPFAGYTWTMKENEVWCEIYKMICFASIWWVTPVVVVPYARKVLEERQIGSKTITFEMIEEKKILRIEDMCGNEVYLGWESVSEVWSLESVFSYRLSYSSGSNFKHFYEDVIRAVAEMSGDVKINIYNINGLSEKSDDVCYKLYANQKATIEKVNAIKSFANHLTQRYFKDLEDIDQNIKETQYLFNVTLNTLDYRIILQSEIYQGNLLLEQVRLIERTISLAFKDIANLEIINFKELLVIERYLKEHYCIQQLLSLDEVYLFKILEFSKISIIGIKETITFLIKLPILDHLKLNYSQIYHLPNFERTIIMPPAKFIVNTDQNFYWTSEECK
ncbi:hypothetical protein FQA39_LY18312 [Lamprigera yunnana]|nr:hypothetical protein FQA39_LY18312 [Lamprigera yunnana]